MPEGQGAGGAGTKGARVADPSGWRKKSLTLTRKLRDREAEIDRLKAAGGGGASGGDAAAQLRIQQLEQEKRQLEERLDELEDKVPAEGTVILSGDDAKAWEAVKGLTLPGDKPLGERISEAVKQRDEYKGKLDVHERNAVIANAAALLGFKPSVLVDLAASKGFRVELRDETVTTNGKSETKKIPYALIGAEDKTGKRLADYVNADLQDYLPALKAGAGAAGANGGQGGAQGGSGAQGTPYPAQQPTVTGGSAGSDDPVAKFLEARTKRAERHTNPLMPALPAKATA